MALDTIPEDENAPVKLFQNHPVEEPKDGTPLITTRWLNNLREILLGNSTDKIKQAAIEGLVELLSDKSALGHTHTVSDITDLLETLAEKVNVIHTHAITDITNLSSSLDSKLDNSIIVTSFHKIPKDYHVPSEKLVKNAIDNISLITGPQGKTGPQGIPGSKGPSGIDGTVGTQGRQGIDGVDGTAGEQGIQGLAGTNGIDGTIGPQGIQGEQGIAGIQGEVGPQGQVELANSEGATKIQIVTILPTSPDPQTIYMVIK